MPSLPPDPPLEPERPSADDATHESEAGVRSFRFAAFARALGARIDGEDLSDWDLAVLHWIDLRISRIQTMQGEAAAREATDQVIDILRQGPDPDSEAAPR